ncbi:hypothetical protein FRC05_001818 [Tulasnella sp. 425]|nr:hypothetical protein FRC05_001818 [Tulasnella sp. 425]
MQSQPPVVPERLQRMFPSLPSLDNLSTEGLFTIIDYQKTIKNAYYSNQAPITPEQIVEAELFALRALNKQARLQFPDEFSANPLGDELRTVVEDALRPLKEDIATLNGKFTALDNKVKELDNQVTKFQRTFGLWAVKQAQGYNSQSVSGTGLHLVPFPDASWPEDPDYPPLTSIDAIKNLDHATLQRYVTKYGLHEGVEADAELRCKLCVHLGVLWIVERRGLLEA